MQFFCVVIIHLAVRAWNVDDQPSQTLRPHKHSFFPLESLSILGPRRILEKNRRLVVTRVRSLTARGSPFFLLGTGTAEGEERKHRTILRISARPIRDKCWTWASYSQQDTCTIWVSLSSLSLPRLVREYFCQLREIEWPPLLGLQRVYVLEI